MKITVREIFDMGLWEEFCEITGTNEWAVNEGLVDYDEEMEISTADAKRLFR